MMTLVPDTLEMALELLDKAIATDSTLITPYFNKANCLINLNRKMEAIRTYERYLHITDNVEEIASVLFNVGKTYDGIGDSIKADGYYRRILNMESLLMKSAKGNPHMKMFLIIIKHYMHMDKEAEEEFNILCEKHKADVDSMTWNRYREVLKVDRMCHYVVRRIQ